MTYVKNNLFQNFHKQFKQQNFRTCYLHIGKSTKEIHGK